MSKRYGGRVPSAAPQQRLTARHDEIATRAPLLQAARQMEAGWDAERGPSPSRWYWLDCPDLRPVTSNDPQLVGHRWGRLVVIGMLKKWRSGSSASWVVRCDCGMYETRSARAIRRALNPDEGCTRCGYVWHLKRQAYFDRTGAWPADFPA